MYDKFIFTSVISVLQQKSLTEISLLLEYIGITDEIFNPRYIYVKEFIYRGNDL